jgi:hypothetical protein
MVEFNVDPRVRAFSRAVKNLILTSTPEQPSPHVGQALPQAVQADVNLDDALRQSERGRGTISHP